MNKSKPSPSPPGPTSRGFRLKEFCEREGISQTTCWNWIRKGYVKASRIGPRAGLRVSYVKDPTSD